MALAVIGCDPEAAVPDESSEALLDESDPAPEGPDQIASNDPGEGAFPSGDCRDGFIQAGPRLCIDETVRQQRRYRRAASDCRDSYAHVCTVEDLDYLFLNTNLDAYYNPKQGNRQRWLGNYVGDDTALCGDRAVTQNNDPDIADFDAECGAQERHPYWCCHDDDDKQYDEDDDGYDEDDDGYDTYGN